MAVQELVCCFTLRPTTALVVEGSAFAPLAQRLTSLSLQLRSRYARDAEMTAVDLRGAGPAIAELACLKELYISGVSSKQYPALQQALLGSKDTGTMHVVYV
jgi:hypothetical protein